MPAVDLNRIYMLRARERRPILNGVNVPDAAGAYQRATMPGLRAQMGIAERGAAIRQREIADRADATQGIIRAVGGAIDAADRVYRRMEAAREKQEAELERAQARQSASTRMEVENRYRQYMLDHAKEIYETPYDRETDGAGNLKITGPFSKALEVHNGFWDNDTKAAELRETLGEDDRARLEQEYANWGFALQSDSAKKQSELNQQYMLKNWKDRGNTLKGELANSLERGDVDAWKRSMMEYVEFAGEGAEIELGIRDLGGGLKRQPTEQQAATISDVKRATAETLAMERIEFLHRSYIMDGDEDTLAEIQAWGGEQALSDAGRLHARELAADAETKRKQVVANQMAEADNAAWNAANQRLEEVMGLDNPMEQREAFWELRETRFHDPQKKRELNEKIDVRLDVVNTEEAYGELALIAKDAGNPNIIRMADKCRRKVENIADPKKREAALALLDGLVGDAEFVSWREKYDEAIAKIEEMDFEPKALADAHGTIRQLIGEIGGFRSARGKQLAAEHTVAVRNEIQTQYTQKTVDVLKHRWYRDPATGRLVNQDKLEALDTFDKWIPFMDRKQLEEVAEAFSKMPVPLQEEDFAGLGDWLGGNGVADLFDWNKIDEKGEMALAKSWGDARTRDIKRGRGRVDVDRRLAGEIYRAVESYVRLRDMDMLQKGNKANMSIAEFMEDYYRQHPDNLAAYRSASLAERVAMTQVALENATAASVYGPFADDEEEGD